MRARGAGSADGRNGQREAVGNWGKAGYVGVIAGGARPSAILTNRTRLSRIFIRASPNPNSLWENKKADHGALPIFCWQTVRI
jgi:hypothetical protein